MGTKMGLREYARHRAARGLIGRTHVAVGKKIRAGILSRSVSYDGRGRPIIDAELADLEWEIGTDPAQQRDPGGSAPTGPAPGQTRLPGMEGAPQDAAAIAQMEEVNKATRNSRAAKIHYDARLAQLTYEEKCRKLVDSDEIRAELARIVATARAGIFAIVPRLSPVLRDMTDVHAIAQALTAELEDALRELVESLGNEKGS